MRRRIWASDWPHERRILPLRVGYRSWVTSSSNSLGNPPFTTSYRASAKRRANKNPGPQSRPGARMRRSKMISRRCGRPPGNRYRKQRCALSKASAFRCLLSRKPLRVFASHSFTPGPFPGPTGERLSPLEVAVNTHAHKDARLRGATGRQVHISRFQLDSQHRDRQRPPDSLGHGADAWRQFRELVEGQGLCAVGERLIRVRVHLDHQAVRAGGNPGQ